MNNAYPAVKYTLDRCAGFISASWTKWLMVEAADSDWSSLFTDMKQTEKLNLVFLYCYIWYNS